MVTHQRTNALLAWVLVALLSVVVGSARAQTLVRFDNFVLDPFVDAPVFGPDGVTPAAGTAYVAQLYVGLEEGSLASSGVPVFFGVGDEAGYFDGGDVLVIFSSLPFLAQVRAWDTSGGSSYEAAVGAGVPVGTSNVIVPATATAAPDGPAYLVKLDSFCIGCQPAHSISEPRSLMLAVAGMMLVIGGTRWRRQFP